jgi:hypothetical protein
VKKPNSVIAAAVGIASRPLYGSSAYSKEIQKAMTASVRKAQADGITDPAKQRTLIQAARQSVKAEYAAREGNLGPTIERAKVNPAQLSAAEIRLLAAAAERTLKTKKGRKKSRDIVERDFRIALCVAEHEKRDGDGGGTEAAVTKAMEPMHFNLRSRETVYSALRRHGMLARAVVQLIHGN